ncbi:MAG: hypothetical protein J6B45_05460 [Clostridia bacterium]|nr:hypothetical protein [Clostridia bacterium]
MKFKIFLFILATVLLLSCFVGCGCSQKDTDSEHDGDEGKLDKTDSSLDKDEGDNSTDKPDNEDESTEKVDLAVVFAVDESASMIHLKSKAVAEMRQALEIIKERNKDATIGLTIVGFADGEEVTGTIGFSRDIEAVINGYEVHDFLGEESTNIAFGLEYSAELLADCTADKKEIYLFSDFLETKGDMISAAEKIDKMDISVTNVKIGHENEVQLSSVQINGKVKHGESVKISVIVKSTVACNAEIVIEDGETTVTRDVYVSAGNNEYLVEYKPSNPGVNGVKVTVNSQNDGLSGNNSVYSWYLYEDKYSILIVDGDDYKGGGQIAQLVEEGIFEGLEGYDFKVVTSKNMPRNLEELLEYDQVVLMNVDFDGIPSELISDSALKRYVEECGRSLVVTFGDKFSSYGGEEFENSVLTEILPVDLTSLNSVEAIVKPTVTGNASSVLQGVMGIENIGGYYDSAIKDGANMVISVGNNVPLYAEWQYGLGNVSVFMSDLGKEEWTGELVKSQDGQRLISNILTVNMNNNQSSTGINYSISKDGDDTVIVAEMLTMLRMNERLLIQITDMNGDVVCTEELTEIAARKYRVQLDLESNTLYYGCLMLINGNERICDRVFFAIADMYNPEYNVLTE